MLERIAVLFDQRHETNFQILQRLEAQIAFNKRVLLNLQYDGTSWNRPDVRYIIFQYLSIHLGFPFGCSPDPHSSFLIVVAHNRNAGVPSAFSNFG